MDQRNNDEQERNNRDECRNKAISSSNCTVLCSGIYLDGGGGDHTGINDKDASSSPTSPTSPTSTLASRVARDRNADGTTGAVGRGAEQQELEPYPPKQRDGESVDGSPSNTENNDRIKRSTMRRREDDDTTTTNVVDQDGFSIAERMAKRFAMEIKKGVPHLELPVFQRRDRTIERLSQKLDEEERQIEEIQRRQQRQQQSSSSTRPFDDGNNIDAYDDLYKEKDNLKKHPRNESEGASPSSSLMKEVIDPRGVANDDNNESDNVCNMHDGIHKLQNDDSDDNKDNHLIHHEMSMIRNHPQYNHIFPTTTSFFPPSFSANGQNIQHHYRHHHRLGQRYDPAVYNSRYIQARRGLLSSSHEVTRNENDGDGFAVAIAVVVDDATEAVTSDTSGHNENNECVAAAATAAATADDDCHSLCGDSTGTSSSSSCSGIISRRSSDILPTMSTPNLLPTLSRSNTIDTTSGSVSRISSSNQQQQQLAQMNIPYAVEYDPTTDGRSNRTGGNCGPIDGDDGETIGRINRYKKRAKSLDQQRLFHLYATIVFVVVVLAVFLGVVFGTDFFLGDDATRNHMDDNDLQASFNITISNLRQSIALDRIVQVIGMEQLLDFNSPYYKAMQWIMYDDQMQLNAQTSSNFMQRYYAAYFYYATTKLGPWKSCNPLDMYTIDDATNTSNRTINASSQTVVDSISATLCSSITIVDEIPIDYNEYKYVPSRRWLSNTNECEWAGLKCDNAGQIMSIDLPGAGLSGSFPEGILVGWPYLQSMILSANELYGTLPIYLVNTLKHLHTIGLGHNKFAGAIPQQWWASTNTKHILNVNIEHNRITGSIPDEIWSQSNLQRLHFGGNMLVGSISTRIGDLRDLKVLSLYNNDLAHTVPSEIGDLQSLISIDLSQNNLKGQIPYQIGNLKHVEYLALENNTLTGPIPSSIGGAVSLRWLALDGNPSLSGTLPESLFSLHLASLDIFSCNLTGTVSPYIGNLSQSLVSLRMSDNFFYGRIPTEFGLLSNLERFWLHSNGFRGSVPMMLPTYRHYDSLPAEFTSDCLPREKRGYPEVRCKMCTICCRDKGAVCLPQTPKIP